MTVYKLVGLIFIFSFAIYFSCSSPKKAVVKLPEQDAFFEYISEYGIFEDNNNPNVINQQLAEYQVINALFTDYAEKGRYVYTPSGESARLKEDGFFEWPEGAMIVKNFYYTKSQVGEDRVIETRLLIKDKNAWKAISYIWDKAQKDAKISKVGDQFSLELTHKEAVIDFEYVVPNKNQCKSCHNHNEKIDPLGFKFSNLNTSVQGPEGQINQLAYLETKGVVSLNEHAEGLVVMASYEDESKDIQDRALAYLDVNCGHCHRPEGPGNTSGLFLQNDETRTNHLGFCKAPVAAGKGSGGRTFDIQPGSADSSILYYRMASLDPGVMMPEVGRGIAHTEGLAIVKEWIDGLEYDCFQ